MPCTDSWGRWGSQMQFSCHMGKSQGEYAMGSSVVYYWWLKSMDSYSDEESCNKTGSEKTSALLKHPFAVPLHSESWQYALSYAEWQGWKKDWWVVCSFQAIYPNPEVFPSHLTSYVFINGREELDCSIQVMLLSVGFSVSIHCTLNCDINCKCSVKGFFALQYKNFSLCPYTALPLSFNGRPQHGETHLKKAEQQGRN